MVYKERAYDHFVEMIRNIEHRVVKGLLTAKPREALDEVKLEETLLSQYANAAQEGRDESMSSPMQQNMLLRTPFSEESEPKVIIREDSPAKSEQQYPNVGRNDPCPCGSGKKFKQCHGK